MPRGTAGLIWRAGFPHRADLCLNWNLTDKMGNGAYVRRATSGSPLVVLTTIYCYSKAQQKRDRNAKDGKEAKSQLKVRHFIVVPHSALET